MITATTSRMDEIEPSHTATGYVYVYIIVSSSLLQHPANIFRKFLWSVYFIISKNSSRDVFSVLHAQWSME